MCSLIQHNYKTELTENKAGRLVAVFQNNVFLIWHLLGILQQASNKKKKKKKKKSECFGKDLEDRGVVWEGQVSRAPPIFFFLKKCWLTF